jgi:hypothetical protein
MMGQMGMVSLIQTEDLRQKVVSALAMSVMNAVRPMIMTAMINAVAAKVHRIASATVHENAAHANVSPRRTPSIQLNCIA